MAGRSHNSSQSGFTTAELLVVLVIIAICLSVASLGLHAGLESQAARGAAQSWQAAACWAQTGVLWHQGTNRVTYGDDGLAVSHDLGLCGGDLGGSAPFVPVGSNLARWSAADGAVTSFGGSFGSPDGGGSLFFAAPGYVYRVVVRPESGLTVRSRDELP